MTALLVMLGAAVGAPLRYLIDRTVQARHESTVPWGTWSVNVLGCLVLGTLAGVGGALPQPVMSLLGTGFCGALTTYSTFGYETVRLIETRAYRAALANVVVSLVVGSGALVLGYLVAR
ncbi:CrcB protein [Herbihabitans rhizosphaerae]|uniref:Fluoride-specific ion channel FluC n=1 Tax=Herbihabitans rhizosphaerae TaxID=1872711 RepID=A0A4Q7KSQ1_9PSEU|nr:fluoride efflux transporter CrcB [Herbihabitans rhizosphaerae]RZS38821.1 CrcB protein [Herbihabitans rhizosphaerae]